MKFLFVCAAGKIPEIGTGHFVRMYEIAGLINNKQKNLSVEIFFFGHFEQKYVKLIKRKRFNLIKCQNINIDGIQFSNLLNKYDFDIVIIDNLDLIFLKELKDFSTNAIIITLDNFIDSPLVDIYLYSTRVGNNLSFEKKLISFPDPSIMVSAPNTPSNSFKVFCSFGGYDNMQYESKLIEAILSLNPMKSITWIFGSSNPKYLRKFIVKGGNITIINKQSEFYKSLSGANLALVSGGLTMFQSLYLGVPTIVIPQYAHQYDSALELETLGACIVKNSPKNSHDFLKLIKLVTMLMNDPISLHRLSSKSREIVKENQIETLANNFLVYEKLEWDSHFFNFPIARIYPQKLTKKIIEYSLAKAKKDQIRCIYYLDSGESFDSLKIAKLNQFNLVDERITFEKKIQEFKKLRTLYRFRFATFADTSVLKEIASDAYLHSRYYFDKNFDLDSCKKFYQEWISKSIKGELDDFVILALENEKIIGFISIKILQNIATIGLVAVTPSHRGKGVGKSLVTYSENLICESKIPIVRVVTQGRNSAALSLYSKLGFIKIKTEYWHHKWID